MDGAAPLLHPEHAGRGCPNRFRAITQAVDVSLKEHGPRISMVRETLLSPGRLRFMARQRKRAGRAGTMITMRPEKAAFQGERGAFSEEAARKLLGRRVEVLPCVRFEDVFRNLSEKKVQAAVVPIENT